MVTPDFILIQFVLVLLISSTSAYIWSFEQTPQQCSNLTISISGQGGQPPYRVLIVPAGTWDNEPRRNLELVFNGNDKKATFELKYPAGSQFVAVVSDASGFASGGTSAAILVGSSTDSSCFGNPDPYKFYYQLDPTHIDQCETNRIFLDDIGTSKVRGNPNYLGIIPGGQSFEIPQGNVSQYGGFVWKPSLRSSTTLILVAGDARGNGTGGVVQYTVGTGAAFDTSCLDENSPSSTPGNPAGSYPTAGGGGGGGGPMRLSGGVIVAVVLGCVALIVVCAMLLWRWKRKHNRRQGLRAVLLDRVDDDDDEEQWKWKRPRKPHDTQGVDLHHYLPEPFRIFRGLPRSNEGWTGLTFFGHEEGSVTSSPNTSSLSLNGATSNSSTSAGASGRGGLYQAIPGGSASVEESSGRRKRPPRRVLAPVNIIQHDDAGLPSPPKELTIPTIVELPPAYTALKRLQPQRGGSAGGETAGGSSEGGTSHDIGGSSGRSAEKAQIDYH